MKKIYFLIAAAAVFAFGCRTPEYYQDQAVQKARAYLLKNSPQLSFEDSSYIRFNKPVIIHSNIVGGTGSLFSSRIKSDINQIQIVWNIPGNDNFFAVWGVCSATMRDFIPERIFVREFKPRDIDRLKAIGRARAYVSKNFFNLLSVEDYNDLRFREPEIYYSKFDLEDEVMPTEDDIQIAMVWTLKTKPDMQLIVIGNSKENLVKFEPVSGTELAISDVKVNLLEPYKQMTPKELRKVQAISNAASKEKKSDSETEDKVEEKSDEKVENKVDEQKIKTEENSKILSPDEARIRDIENSLKKEKKSETSADKEAANDEKIVDELPEAPELDTENDLKEPEK
jgi:hypothetical protein